MSTNDDNNAKPLTDEVGGLLAFLPQLSEEEWAARDARVAADRASLAHVAQLPPTLDLADLGWPSRALREARSADASRPAVQRLLAHRFDERCVAVLSGQRGIGKTVAAARWAMTRGIPARFVRATEFARMSRYDAGTFGRVLEERALVLDDLGAEFEDVAGSFRVSLDELVDTFYGDERPLVITTNCKTEAFGARYGERVADRLRECARSIEIAGDTLRRGRS